MGRVGQTMAETLGEVSIELQRVRGQRDEAQQRLVVLDAQRCQTCRHFRRSNLAERPGERPGATYPDWGVCDLICLPDYGDTVTTPAYVMDASEYGATLHVRGDFGCVLHEQASDR